MKNLIICDFETFVTKLEEINLDPAEIYDIGLFNMSTDYNEIPNNTTYLQVSISFEKINNLNYLQVFLKNKQRNVKAEDNVIMSIYDNFEHGLIIYRNQEFFTNKVVKNLYDQFLQRESSKDESPHDIFKFIVEEYREINLIKSSSTTYSNIDLNKTLSGLGIFIGLLFKHCKIDHSYYTTHVPKYLKNSKMVDYEKVDYFFELLDKTSSKYIKNTNNDNKHNIGSFKVKSKGNIKKYYEIEIDIKSDKYSEFDNQSVIILKDITNEVLLDKTETDLQNKELSMYKLSYNMKTPISVIHYLIEDSLNSTRRNSKTYDAFHLNFGNLGNIGNIINTGNVDELIEHQDKSLITSSKSQYYSPFLNKLKNISDLNNSIDLNYSYYYSCLYTYLIHLMDEFNSINAPDFDYNSNKKILFQNDTSIFKNSKLNEILDFCYFVFHTKQKVDPNKRGLVAIVNGYSSDTNIIKVLVKNEFKVVQMLLTLLSISDDLLTSGELVLTVKLDTNVNSRNNNQILTNIKITITATGIINSKDNLETLEQFIKLPNKEKFVCNNFGLLNLIDLENYLNIKVKFHHDVKTENSFLFSFEIPYEVFNGMNEQVNSVLSNSINTFKKFNSNISNASDIFVTKRISERSNNETAKDVLQNLNGDEVKRKNTTSFFMFQKNNTTNNILKRNNSDCIRQEDVKFNFINLRNIGNISNLGNLSTLGNIYKTEGNSDNNLNNFNDLSLDKEMFSNNSHDSFKPVSKIKKNKVHKYDVDNDGMMSASLNSFADINSRNSRISNTENRNQEKDEDLLPMVSDYVSSNSKL